jgi:CDP-diacylglycerol--serine O-phosphatidyltransferase
MKRIRTIAVLPTMFTLGNLVCGFFAIVVASRIDTRPDAATLSDPTNVMISAWLILLAMVFDVFDGQVARMSRSSSDFGEQLDSLCDLVSFGVAPAFLLVRMVPDFAVLHTEGIWMIAASFAACVALRLARFTVETDDEDDHLTFKGLPSPAGAAAIGSFAIAFYALRKETATFPYAESLDNILQAALPFYAVLVALLMVSRIPYPHVVNQIFRGRRTFGHVVSVLFAILVVAMIPGFAVPALCFVFVVGGPIRYAWIEYVQRRSHKESLF